MEAQPKSPGKAHARFAFFGNPQKKKYAAGNAQFLSERVRRGSSSVEVALTIIGGVAEHQS